MQSTRGKSVVWDPAGSSRFLVGGGAELRLYDHEVRQHSFSLLQTPADPIEPREQEVTPSSSSSPDLKHRFSTASVTTELTGLRAFAWYPHSRTPLVAAGLATGRVLLLGLDGGEGGRGGQGGATPPSVQINVRHSRPCNVVAFSPTQPGLLAVGLEKGRGESLLVYDISRSVDPSASSSALGSGAPFPTRTFSLSREHSGGSRGRAHSPATPSALEPIPLLSFGSSEAVTSCAFLSSPSSSASSGPSSGASNSSALLAAAMANKWLRVYDLRAPPQTVTTWGTRAVYGVAANPFNGQQFTSHGDDGIVRLWDLRVPLDPLLSFSETDAGSVPARKPRANVVAKPLAETAWSPDRRGVFTTLEKDGQALRVWQLVDGPGPRLIGARLSPHSLTSFTFVPSSLSSSSNDPSLRFLTLSRETSHPGSSGHSLSLLTLPSDPCVSFLERGLALSSSSSAPPATFSIPPPSAADLHAADEPDQVGQSPVPPTALSLAMSPPPDRGRTLSLAGLPPLVIDRNQTPRPGGAGPGMMRRISSGAVLQLPGASTRLAAEVGDGEGGIGGEADLSALASDMSGLVRERIEAGYGGDAATNAALSEGGVREFWLWVARAQSLSSDACFADWDFRFRGVLRILLGFPSGTTNPNLHTPPASSSSTPGPTVPSASRYSTPRSIYSDISRSLRRGDEAQSKTAAYAAACAQLVERRRLDTFAIAASQYAAQRKIALQVCGAEWEEGWEAVCSRLQRHGEYEAAARHAFFSGQLEKSMYYLRMCKDENLRMLAPILAAYLTQKDAHQGAESNFSNLCRTLSSDVERPWVRAAFAYCATSDWRELVDETGLPLKDRVAVALRFLSDSELIPFLQELGEEALSSSDLEAVVLFGLRNDGLKLLQSYVDRTSDVQTVALACSFTSPGLIRADLRVQRWVEAYRSLLDTFQLYAARALFDAARGQRARAALEQAKIAGRKEEAREVAQAMRRAAPPQVLVRCQFCGTTVSPAGGKGGLGVGEGRGGVGPVGVKSTVCPSCSKQLPACSICLLRPSVHSFEADGPSTLCWCQRCRHGGHVEHVLAWFETSRVCAVAGCECECNSERRP
ncbi:hypothetical protein JCM8097_008599 [Rhodosporidiobolus ruineniae]